MKFTEVNPFNKKIQNKINKSVIKTIQKKDFILGENVKKFEIKFSKLSNSKYAIGCATGTDALLLALKSLNLKKNHEVIIPGMSYISTGLCVALNNNKIIFADIDDDTGLISIDSVKKKLSKNTKVIIPVNLYGQKVNLKQLRKIVGKNVSIIEDSAQSHFSYSCYDCGNGMNEICCKKERNHTYADISCYSFYPSKNLGAYGDGGIVTTNNRSLYNKINILRNLGAVKKNLHDYEGLNSRLDTIQASVLLEKIKYSNSHNDYRRMISNFYDENLSHISDIKLTLSNPGSSRHLYVIRVKNRNKLSKYLLKNKIPIQYHYPYSLNKTGALKNKIKKVKLVNSEKWAKECISLPLYPFMPLNEAKRVVSFIKKFYR
tara:strand:- start:654 stop:1778 length:1125 start_codon:yes stop_codon:yes gene_type:complete